MVFLRIALIGLMPILAPNATLAFDLTRPAHSFEQEQANSAAAHEEVLGQFGGIYDDAELSAYVDRVGQRVAAVSDMPDRPFQFFVLNTPMVNAFTTGGGYVYVTRGILASINSEAELAALLGHEIGHVTARHTARRETRMQQDRAISIGIGLLTGSLTAALLTEGTGGLLRQAYSRGQEAESDKLGIVSMSKAGYDPSAMPAMLTTLKREVALMNKLAGNTGSNQPPAWLSDHPETDDRIRDTKKQVSRMPAASRGEYLGRDPHLDAIDGVLFGPDPSFGVLLDNSFLHPGLGLMFDIPEGFELQDLGGVLMAAHDNGSVVLLAAAAWPDDKALESFALEAWYSLTDGDLGGLDRLETGERNGMATVEAAKSVRTRLGNINMQGVTFRVGGGIVANISLLTEASPTQAQLEGFRSFADSFRKTTASDLARVPNPRISVVGVKNGDTVESISKAMISDSFKVDRFEALNGVGGQLEEGMRVKLIVDGG